VSPWREVTLLARTHVLPLVSYVACICAECYRRRQTTDDDDRHQRDSLSLAFYTMCRRVSNKMPDRTAPPTAAYHWTFVSPLDSQFQILVDFPLHSMSFPFYRLLYIPRLHIWSVPQMEENGKFGIGIAWLDQELYGSLTQTCLVICLHRSWLCHCCVDLEELMLVTDKTYAQNSPCGAVDRRKFTTKWSLYGTSHSTFTVGINSKSYTWNVHSVQETSRNFLRRPTRVAFLPMPDASE